MIYGSMISLPIHGHGFMALIQLIRMVSRKRKQKFIFFVDILLFFSGIYGTQGTGTTSTTPGARFGANSWTDLNGNLWLFGGSGYDSSSYGEFLIYLF